MNMHTAITGKMWVMLGGCAVLLVVFALANSGTTEKDSQSPSAPKQVTAPMIKPSPFTTPQLSQKRLNGFNKLESNNQDKIFYRGTSTNGDMIIFKISDAWHLLSQDRKEALCNGMVKRWHMLGQPIGIIEDPGSLKFEFHHAESDGRLASWDGFWGFKLEK